jgi:hypothetical protein
MRSFHRPADVPHGCPCDGDFKRAGGSWFDDELGIGWLLDRNIDRPGTDGRAVLNAARTTSTVKDPLRCRRHCGRRLRAPAASRRGRKRSQRWLDSPCRLHCARVSVQSRPAWNRADPFRNLAQLIIGSRLPFERAAGSFSGGLPVQTLRTAAAESTGPGDFHPSTVNASMACVMPRQMHGSWQGRFNG